MNVARTTPQTWIPTQRLVAPRWLHWLLCALFLVPTVFTPASPCYGGDSACDDEESTGCPVRVPVNEDDLDETVKVSSYVRTARRSMRQVRTPVRGPSRVLRTSGPDASVGNPSPLLNIAGCEHARRNGLGTALRL